MVDQNQAAKAISLLRGEKLPPNWILLDRPNPEKKHLYYVAGRVSAHESGRTWLNGVVFHERFSTMLTKIKALTKQERFKSGQQKQADRQQANKAAPVSSHMRQILSGDKIHRRQLAKALKPLENESYLVWKAQRKAEREWKAQQKAEQEAAKAKKATT